MQILPSIWEQRLAEHEAFISQRHRLDDRWRHLDSAINRLIIGGAAGALILSITFLDRIAPSPAHGTLWLVKWAWIVLSVTLFLGFASYWTARSAAYEMLAQHDKQYGAVRRGEKPEDYPVARIAGAVASWTEASAAVGLMVGVVLLAAFAWKNLPLEVEAAGPAQVVEQVAPTQAEGVQPADTS